MERKTVLLLVPSIVIAVVLGIGILGHFGISIYPISKVSCGCQNRIPDQYYLMLGIVIILASLPITYYYIFKKMEKKLNEHVESLSRIISKNKTKKENTSNEKKILKFLSPSEQEIINLILKNEGEILQSQISKENNLTKLKVHRTVKSLEEKKIVETEHHGKTNKISLTSYFRKALKF